MTTRRAPGAGPVVAVVAVLALVACGGRGDGSTEPRPDPGPGDPAAPAAPPAAPWSAPALTAVPPIHLEEWSAADNRSTCAPLAFDPAAIHEDATPRRAQFGGGWGVAYDLPGLRSAFGIAGTGVEPGPDTYDDWPHRIVWADGSSAGWGPEGGSGPRQLAYLRVEGQRCLYNVWSNLGGEHLEALLRSIRFVARTGR